MVGSPGRMRSPRHLRTCSHQAWTLRSFPSFSTLCPRGSSPALRNSSAAVSLLALAHAESGEPEVRALRSGSTARLGLTWLERRRWDMETLRDRRHIKYTLPNLFPLCFAFLIANSSNHRRSRLQHPSFETCSSNNPSPIAMCKPGTCATCRTPLHLLSPSPQP